MNTICPQCNKPWSESEIEFQVCNDCGFSDENARLKLSAKNLGKSVFKWLIIIFIAVLIGAIGATVTQGNIGLWVFLGGAISIAIYHIARFLLTKK